jgi:hypothetical protein
MTCKLGNLTRRSEMLPAVDEDNSNNNNFVRDGNDKGHKK